MRRYKEELLILLAEKERRFKLNPIKYTPQHRKQIEASLSTKAIRALFWGNRVGKTDWGAQEVASYLDGYSRDDITMRTNDDKFIKMPVINKRKIVLPIEIWAACPSYDLQKETTQKKLERYLPNDKIADITFIKKGVWGEVKMKDGSRINFKSYEQGREKFQGAGKRLVWFDEEPPKDIWEECFVRSEAGIPLDIILTMTPVNGMTWVYDDIYMATDNPDLFVSKATWEDNPWLTEKQKEQMTRGLSAHAIAVRKEGEFVERTGLVCPWWQRSAHLADLSYDENWYVGAAMDFGYSNPTAFGLIGVDYDDNLSLFDGFYERGLTTPRIAERIVHLCSLYSINMNNLTIICDSAQASSIAELNDISAQQGYGFTCIGIKKISGTNARNWDEYRADKMEQYGRIDELGKTKFKVSNKLTWFDEKEGKNVNWFVKEIESLKWSEVASPNSSDKQQSDLWNPRYPNHAIDMLSYFIVDHTDVPEEKTPKPWEGKIPGTYVPPSPDEDEDANLWEVPQDDNYWDDAV